MQRDRDAATPTTKSEHAERVQQRGHRVGLLRLPSSTVARPRRAPRRRRRARRRRSEVRRCRRGYVVRRPRTSADGVDDVEERRAARRGTPRRTPRWRRCRPPGAVPPASPARRARRDGRERLVVERLELPGLRLRSSRTGAAASGDPVGPGQAERDREPHVRRAAPGRASSRRRTRPSSGPPTAGARRRRSRSKGMPKSRCASITSRPLLTRVAELIVTTGPMSQVGWASACSGVTSASSARRAAAERAAAGGEHQPAHLVGACRRAGTGRARECSESTGTIWPGLAARRDQRAADDQRLLVGQREGACRRRARPAWARSPTAPVMPLSTTSAPQRGELVRGVRARRALGGGMPAGRPRCGSRARPRAAGRRRRRARPRRRGTPSSRACAASRSRLPPADERRRRGSGRGCGRTTSRAWVPIEPVEPSRTMRRGRAGVSVTAAFSRSRRGQTVTPLARSSSSRLKA